MKHKFLLLILLVIMTGEFTFAQKFDALNKPNTFRNSDNPYYWKNRKPFEGYWQQDVHYQIKAKVDERTRIIDASEELTYWNNSPDELPFVYFHLYQNAFQPGSYLDGLYKANDFPTRYGGYEDKKLGTVIESITIGGQTLKVELDNTIMKVYLPKPLKSGESITFDIKFKSYFDSGNVRRRMKIFNAYGFRHFDGVHWYPRIAVYDRKFGWSKDQHLSREFYGDFGCYDVELTFANNYIVEATGNLINRDEVLPADLREKLDIKNFKDKPLDEKPSVIIPYDSTLKKTWKYHAENVHDFAFTADPTYRIGEVTWNGIKCISLVQEPHASKWQNAAEYTAKVIKTYSEEIGMYAYPKMIVADARDGMEYPMLTLDGGFDPDYRGLLAHEVGHNWFYGMVGNNETYRASLDEGFTQWLTALALEKIDGPEMVVSPANTAYERLFKSPEMVRDRSVFNGYIFDAAHDNDAFLNTHSDDFGGALRHGGGYRHVYYKTAAMLYNLEYVLGDELFSAAMKNYFNQWKICHPYPEDFRNSFIQFTKVDLNWFFDQWLETTKKIDYGIKCLKKGKEKDEYIITFKRKQKMQMPIDFEVLGKDSTVYNFHIPNDWFVKKTSATVLPKWYGWDKINPEYQAKVTIPGGVKNVTIDPSNRLADMYMIDNKQKGKATFSWDSRINQSSDRNNYEVFFRPDVWYNLYDGVKAGLHINGNYLQHFHKFELSAWFNSGLFQGNFDSIIPINKYDGFSFVFNYKNNLDQLMKGAFWSVGLRRVDGLYAGQLGFEKSFNQEKDKAYVQFKSMYRRDDDDLTYLLYPKEWKAGELNNIVTLGLEHRYHYVKGDGKIDFKLRSSSIGSDYSFAQLSLTVTNRTQLWKTVLSTRTFAQLGTGTNVPFESSLFLAGANPEEMMDNKYTRSRAFFNNDWLGFGENINHFNYGGGLNLRGYSGYLNPYLDKNGNMRTLYKGNSGAAVNAELEFDKVIGLRDSYFRNTLAIRTYIFGDAGIINYNNQDNLPKFADIRADAGIGTAWTIKRWGPLAKVKPLTIRFDVPLFLNRTPAVSPDFVQFRWVLGINRAF